MIKSKLAGSPHQRWYDTCYGLGSTKGKRTLFKNYDFTSSGGYKPLFQTRNHTTYKLGHLFEQPRTKGEI